ncbi:hypothetical protein EVAR_102319_1 [Eumeta japonica]|uniref:Uncharacterized protein n=1 Tax=Eumeta variegata TaxID=151549 RepID=A0A4C2AF50_EUMVA|nr:hypothetical protein EVAR_102319_1 [Eumeta japonica]
MGVPVSGLEDIKQTIAVGGSCLLLPPPRKGQMYVSTQTKIILRRDEGLDTLTLLATPATHRCISLNERLRDENDEEPVLVNGGEHLPSDSPPVESTPSPSSARSKYWDRTLTLKLDVT